MISFRGLLLSALLAAPSLPAQQAAAVTTTPSAVQRSRHKVDLTNTYHRLICVVPMIGSGTRADPRRPAYAPLPAATGKALPRSGIVGFGFLESDDKKNAIVEFVAADPGAFKPILADKSVIVFEKGKAQVQPAAVQTQLRSFKKDFTIDQLRVMVP